MALFVAFRRCGRVSRPRNFGLLTRVRAVYTHISPTYPRWIIGPARRSDHQRRYGRPVRPKAPINDESRKTNARAFVLRPFSPLRARRILTWQCGVPRHHPSLSCLVRALHQSLMLVLTFRTMLVARRHRCFECFTLCLKKTNPECYKMPWFAAVCMFMIDKRQEMAAYLALLPRPQPPRKPLTKPPMPERIGTST
jgi:hypothetical protein